MSAITENAQEPVPESSTAVPVSSEASPSPVEDDSQKIKRVYISNVDFGTTEDDLVEFLQEYNVISVIVPSHTLRMLKGKQQRPLGIAYAEFETHESAARVVEELNGKKLDGRELRIKFYVPYTPKKRFTRKASSLISRHSGSEENVPSDGNVAGDAENSSKKQVSDQETKIEPVKKNQEISADTIFVGRLHPKTTDTDLRAFFAEYDPFDIYLFKGRYTRRSFHFAQRHVSALVTVLADNGQENAIKNLSNKKLNGKYIKLRPAYLSKIEEVKNAVLERQEQLKKEALKTVAADLEEDPQTVEKPVQIESEHVATEDSSSEGNVIATNEPESSPGQH